MEFTIKKLLSIIRSLKANGFQGVCIRAVITFARFMAIYFRRYLRAISLLVALIVLLIHCTSPEQRATRRIGAARLNQLVPLRNVYTDEIYGRYRRQDYEGPLCKDEGENEGEDRRSRSRSSSSRDQDCESICREMYNDHSRVCENAPAELVYDLYEFFKKMRRIRQPNSLFRQVDISNFGVMIDLDVEPMLELISDWSARETKLFLIWAAETIQISAAIQHHDNDDLILEHAFERLGEEHNFRGVQGVLAGFSEDLFGFTETFLSLAQHQRNEAAFVIAHRVLEQVCENEVCIVRAYCSRESSDRLLNVRRCPYQTPGRLAGSRSNHCYVHGAEVWSFWEVLNRDRRIEDKKITFDSDYKINQAKCDSEEICGEDVDSPCRRELD